MPPSSIIFAFDVGRKKTGIAIGNLLTGGARPLATAHGDNAKQMQIIAQYIREWCPAKCIVGLPTRGDGRAYKMTKVSQDFASQVSREFSLPVEFVDERLTSVAARSQNATDIDAAAASIILQNWLDAQNGEPPSKSF